MDECTLLENAAKAIGFMAWKNHANAWQLYDGDPDNGNGKYIRFWNPIKYDADALQLAVNLGMFVMCPDDDDPHAIVRTNRSEADDGMARSDQCDDRYAATRRAIVLAAANIGAAMPVNALLRG